MPRGIIQSFDDDEQSGTLKPESGGDEIPFSLEDVQDYHEGEVIQRGDQVTYTEEGGSAKSVHRIATRGYE